MNLPPKQGLYDPRFEHDACGVGFVVDIKGRRSHEIIRQGIKILENLTHRGACGCDPLTGDGAGILFQMPDKFLRKTVKPLNDRITLLDDGGGVVSGITAMLAAGHTPGHMIYQLESDGQRLAITADTANHYVFSLQFPDWEVRFDADKSAAAATRKVVFGMIAADRIPFIGYHMPFPGVGYVEPKDAGFRFVPMSYQMMLEG